MSISDEQLYLPPQHDWITGDLIKDVAWLKWFNNVGNLHKSIKFVNVEGDLDDIADGTSYGRVLITDISAGHILLSETVGDLDDVDDGTSYGKVALTSISAGKIVLAGLDTSATDQMFTTTTKRTNIEAGLLDIVGSPPENLLLNPGFEENDGSDAYAWTIGSGRATVLTGGDGSNVFYRVTRTGTNIYGYNRTLDDSALRYIEVVEGDVYEYGGSARSSNGSCVARLGIVTHDKDKGQVTVTGPTTTETSWTSVTTTRYTIPSGVRFISFFAGALTSDGYADFDNLFLRKVDTLTWSWTSSSDRTTIDGGNIYADSITVSKLAVDATGRMFTNSAMQTNVEGWKHASDITKIDGGDIYTDTVTATQINVTDLSSLSANCGAITAGTLSSTDWAAAAGVRLDLANRWLKMGGSNVTAAGGAAGIFLGLDTSYKFYIGNGSTNFFKFDGTNVSWSTTGASSAIVESGGDILVKGGGDILMEASDSTPSIINFQDASPGTYDIHIARRATNDALCIYPDTANTCYFDIGLTPAGAVQRFSAIQFWGEFIDFFATDSGTTDEVGIQAEPNYNLTLYHSDSGGATAKIEIDGHDDQIRFDAGDYQFAAAGPTNEGANFTLKGAGSYDDWTLDVYQDSVRLYLNVDDADVRVFQIFNSASSRDVHLFVDGDLRTTAGVLWIAERAQYKTYEAGYGQLWIKNQSPCELWFTDDAGNHNQIAFVS